MRSRLRFLVVGLFSLLCSSLTAANLKVNLAPSQAVSAGAQWQVDGGIWRNSGVTVKNLSNGTHAVTFKTVNGWIAPAPLSVTLSGSNTTVSATYVRSASLTVNLTPASGQWRVDGSAWKASGTTATGLTPGNHTIDYIPLPGYSSPATEAVSLTAGQTSTLTRSYTQLAQISITLIPSEGQWRVDGGEWQASGATITGLAAGDHPVEYSSLANYNTPPPETVALTDGQIAQLARTYVPLLYTAASTGVPGLYDYTGANAGGAHAINLEGAVAGGTFISGQVVGYIYVDGVLEQTGNLGGPGFALELNDRRVTVGFSLLGSTSFERHATRYDNGSLQSIDAGGTAFGVNFDGAVVGQSGTGSAFLHVDGAMFDLGKWGGQSATALDINDSDVIVGVANTSGSSISQAVRYHDGQIEIIPGLGGTANRANAINNAGVIVGDGSFSGSSPRHAFRHASGVTMDLGTLGGANSRALDLNDAGVIVGWAEVAANTPHAFVYRDGTMLDLNSIVSLPPGVVLTAATGINASGQIIANGSDALGYILTPITDLGGVSVQLTDGTGQWRVDGGAWQNPDAIDSGLTAGSHTIEYAPVAGYDAPAGETVTVNSGRTTVIRRGYTSIPAQLRVIVSPGTGQWRIDGGAWQASGTTIISLTSGSHTVEYDNLDGYTAPATETVTLSAGQSLSLNRSYTPAPTQLTVTLTPSVGEWRLTTETTWRASGTTVPLTPGTYSIYYAPLGGYNGPINDTITLSLGQSLELTRNYIPITASPSYTAVQISSPDGNWNTANAINNSSVVAGQKHIGGASFIAYRHDSGGMQELGTLGGISSSAHGINGVGVIVGQGQTAAGHTHAFVLNDGTLQDLGTLGGTFSTATGINDAGWIVGRSSLATGRYHAFRHDGTSMVDLGTLGGNHSYARGINQANVIVGESDTAAGDNHAFVLTAGVMQDLGTFGGSWSAAYDINDAGIVVGGAEIVPGTPHAFIFSDGTLHDLGTLGAQASSVALAINNAGTVVGYAFTNQQIDLRPFVMVDGVMTDINTLVNIPGVLLTQARDINDLGQIVVYGTNFATDVSFILTPVSAPSASLQVNLTPATGQWRVDGGAWHASGATVASLGSGNHTVEYSSLSGYATPSSETVTLASGQTTSLARSYSALGSVRTYLMPSAESRWRLDGGEWLISGADTINVSLGSHLVEFMDIPGYITPAAQTIIVSSGQTTDVYATYTSLGSVRAYLMPSAESRWRLDGGEWRISGADTINVSLGSHLVEFMDIPGYITPAPQTITVSSGQTTDVYATYTSLGSVRAYLMPSAESRWRLDGGEWLISGADTINVSLGSHLVEFIDIPGYTTPAAQTVSVTSGQVTEIYASYEQATDVAQLSVSLIPTRGQWRLDGGEWHDHGAYVTNLSVGDHTIEYRALPNYTSPPTETVTLTNGQSAYLDRVYQLVPSVQYNVTDLGNLGGTWDTNAAALNLSGMVTGTSHIATGPARAFLYRDGAMQSLGTVAGDLYSFGYGINDDGEVVGMSSSSGEATHPFVYRDGSMQDLGSLGGITGAGYDISNTGFAVGRSQASATQSYAFIHDGTAMVSLGSLGGSDHIAFAMNENGTIVGAARAFSGYHAFRWQNGVMEDVNPLLNTSTSYAYDVNEAGTIAGIRIFGGDYRGFSLTADGVVQDLGRLGATYTYARGINSSGHIVGNSSADNGNHAFLHRGAGIEDLNHLVNLPDVILEFAEDINDLGQIAVNGSNGHAYLLTPINAPGGLQLDLTPANAQWRVEGGAWQANGSAILGLAIGNHTVEYATLEGYTTPAPETVTVSSGRLLQVSRSYVAAPQTAQLSITLAPTTGEWRVDGGAWQASGATVGGLAPGSHTIDYNEVSGHTSPAAETVNLITGDTLTLTRGYTVTPGLSAQLKISLNPSYGKWRINGGGWFKSDYNATFLLSGTYTVEYYGLSGFEAPPTETVTLIAGPNSFQRNYVQLATITVTLSPATAKWRINGSSWRDSGTSRSVTPGNHLIEYSYVSGYSTPPAENLTLPAGATSIQRTYN